jgi:hypothetical protein
MTLVQISFFFDRLIWTALAENKYATKKDREQSRRDS